MKTPTLATFALLAMVIAVPSASAATAYDSSDDARRLKNGSARSGSLIGATNEPGERSRCAKRTTSSVWLSFVGTGGKVRFALDIPYFSNSIPGKGRSHQQFAAVFDVFRVDKGGTTGVECGRSESPYFSAVREFKTRRNARYLIRIAAQAGATPGAFFYRLGTPEPFPSSPGRLIRKWSVHGAVNSVTNRYDLWWRNLRRGIHYVIGIHDRSQTLGMRLFTPGQHAWARGSEPTLDGPRPGMVYKPSQSGRHKFLINTDFSTVRNLPYSLYARKAQKDDYPPGTPLLGRTMRGKFGWKSFDPWDIGTFYLPRSAYLRFTTHSKSTLDLTLQRASGSEEYLRCLRRCPDEEPGRGGMATTEKLAPGSYHLRLTSDDDEVGYSVRWRRAKTPPPQFGG